MWWTCAGVLYRDGFSAPGVSALLLAAFLYRRRRAKWRFATHAYARVLIEARVLSTRILEKTRRNNDSYADPHPSKLVSQVRGSPLAAPFESSSLTEALAFLERPAHLEVRWDGAWRLVDLERVSVVVTA